MKRIVLTVLLLLPTLISCGESEKYTLLGEILVMQEDGITATDQGNCVATGFTTHIRGGDTVAITLANGDEIETTLTDGRITDEGNCSFEFMADVPDSDRYAFTVHGMTEVREKRTIGTSIPDGLGHANEASGDWWVTIEFQS